MKNRLLATLIISTTMFPVLAFAQNEHISRAYVQTQLVQAEQNGTLHVSNAHYPNDVATSTAASVSKSGYGTSTAGDTQSGSTTQGAAMNTLYSHR